MHPVSDPSVVWHGGIGHRLLSVDSGAECYRCGMDADDSAWQELIPDCAGPDSRQSHYWNGITTDAIECAWCGTGVTPETDYATIPTCRDN